MTCRLRTEVSDRLRKDWNVIRLSERNCSLSRKYQWRGMAVAGRWSKRRIHVIVCATPPAIAGSCDTMVVQ